MSSRAEVVLEMASRGRYDRAQARRSPAILQILAKVSSPDVPVSRSLSMSLMRRLIFRPISETFGTAHGERATAFLTSFAVRPALTRSLSSSATSIILSLGSKTVLSSRSSKACTTSLRRTTVPCLRWIGCRFSAVKIGYLGASTGFNLDSGLSVFLTPPPRSGRPFWTCDR